ncbi:MAG: hypothetical protein ABSA76_15950, partial [Bacteroidales bacterium]
MGYTLAEQLAKGQPINADELRSAGELGVTMTIPEFARFAMGRSMGNYLMSSPKAEEMANNISLSASEMRDKAFDIRDKARSETDLQKKAVQEMTANAIDGFADIKVVSGEVKKNLAPFTEAIEKSELPPDKQQLLKDKIDATETAGVSTPEITKLNNDTESLKKLVKKWEGKKDVPETIRNAKVEALNEQIADKEKQIKVIITSEAKEEPEGLQKVQPEWDKNKWLGEFKRFTGMTVAEQG